MIFHPGEGRRKKRIELEPRETYSFWTMEDILQMKSIRVLVNIKFSRARVTMILRMRLAKRKLGKADEGERLRGYH